MSLTDRQRMSGVRAPAVAGMFYPAQPAALKQAVDDLLHQASADQASADQPVENGPTPKAMIAPHAGYTYSGPTASLAFAPLRKLAGHVERVVVLGPSHHVALSGIALPTADRFETPLGQVEIDLEMAESLLELPDVHIDDAPHVREHSLEVELPFLQRALGNFRLVPLVVGQLSPTRVADVLYRAWGDDKTRIVISSDLSHFLDYETARQSDRQTADEILDLRARLSPRQACGAVAINGLLEIAGGRRPLTPQLLDLRSSGDTAGDHTRVVGYGAFAFS